MKAVVVSNGPLKFSSARKILPLLDLLGKFRRVLACSCSQNFRNCSHARILALCIGFCGTEINVSLRGTPMNSAIKFR